MLTQLLCYTPLTFPASCPCFAFTAVCLLLCINSNIKNVVLAPLLEEAASSSLQEKAGKGQQRAEPSSHSATVAANRFLQTLE
jgi:hypothetical protein